MSSSFLLTSPNAVGLPAAERGDAPVPATSALVDARWPHIEHLLAESKAEEAISLMEALAVEMRRTTVNDALLYREALTLARRILYDDLAQIGRITEYEKPARAALHRCAGWDEELRLYIEELK